MSGLTFPDGLVSGWSFEEPAGSPRVSFGPQRSVLSEMNGPIARVEGGILGRFAARIDRGQWFRIPRSEIGRLNIHGSSGVTVVAWIRRQADNPWQFIAGVWDERRSKRQYAMFTSGKWKTDRTTWTRTPASHQPHGYVSAEGGHTPGHPACFSYATGGTFLERDRWYCVGFTFDGRAIRVYVDGRLDRLERHNPFDYDKPIFDGGSDGADFTVAARGHALWKDYPAGAPPADEGFVGVLGGLLVFERALGDDEMAGLSDSAARSTSRT